MPRFGAVWRAPNRPACTPHRHASVGRPHIVIVPLSSVLMRQKYWLVWGLQPVSRWTELVTISPRASCDAVTRREGRLARSPRPHSSQWAQSRHELAPIVHSPCRSYPGRVISRPSRVRQLHHVAALVCHSLCMGPSWRCLVAGCRRAQPDGRALERSSQGTVARWRLRSTAELAPRKRMRYERFRFQDTSCGSIRGRENQLHVGGE